MQSEPCKFESGLPVCMGISNERSCTGMVKSQKGMLSHNRVHQHLLATWVAFVLRLYRALQ